MLGIFGFNDSTGTLNFVATMMVYPSLAHYERTESSVRNLVTKLSASVEGMGGGADTYDWLTCVEKFSDVLGLFGGRFAETRSNEHEIGGLQMLPTANSCLVIGINMFAGRIPSEKNFAVKAMLLGEDFGKHGHTFLRSIFFVTRNQNDGLSLAGTFFPRQIENFMMSSENGKDRR